VPEGDTVWLAARRMHDALAGRTLTVSDFRLPNLATTDLVGRSVLEVVARGKHLLVRTADPGAPALTVHTHFRMDGSWHIYRAGERWRGGASHHIRVVLAVPDAVAVGYRLHDVAVVPSEEEDRLVGHLGPDLLGADWDLDEALRRLSAAPDRQIGPALLDQRNLAGIGNLYKAEVLFLRGVNPWSPVGSVRDLPALVTTARRLLHANRDRWEQVTTGSTRKGEHHWVFERPGRACRRCGALVQVADQGDPPYDRLTYWCPRCQPLPDGAGPSG
jgi:endonuclease-8